MVTAMDPCVDFTYGMETLYSQLQLQNYNTHYLSLLRFLNCTIPLSLTGVLVFYSTFVAILTG